MYGLFRYIHLGGLGGKCRLKKHTLSIWDEQKARSPAWLFHIPAASTYQLDLVNLKPPGKKRLTGWR